MKHKRKEERKGTLKEEEEKMNLMDLSEGRDDKRDVGGREEGLEQGINEWEAGERQERFSRGKENKEEKENKREGERNGIKEEKRAWEKIKKRRE